MGILPLIVIAALLFLPFVLLGVYGTFIAFGVVFLYGAWHMEGPGGLVMLFLAGAMIGLILCLL